MSEDLPQTASEIAAVMREAQSIFGNLREHHSRAFLLCLASELRKWEWAEGGTFTKFEDGLRSCIMCGRVISDDVLNADILEMEK